MATMRLLMQFPELIGPFLDANQDPIGREHWRDELREWCQVRMKEDLPSGVSQTELVEKAFRAGLRELGKQGIEEVCRVDFGWDGYDFSMFTTRAEEAWFGEAGQVTIPPEYFRDTARRPYQSIGWQRALAREYEQNSRDAGATRIDFEMDRDLRALSVTDDGCGMSYATLKDKLLVMGGTEKPKGAVGGFGKAKEILFFAWERFEIRTQRRGGDPIMVSGRGAAYEMMPGPEMDGGSGTECCIWFPEGEDMRELEQQMKDQLGLSDGPASVYWNGELVRPLKAGKLIRETDWCRVHVQKTRKGEPLNDPEAHIRINGVAMFDRYIGQRKAQVVVELMGTSLAMLNESRTELTWEYRRKLDEIIEEIIVDPESTLKPKPQLVMERLGGQAVVQVEPPISLAPAVEAVTGAAKGWIDGGLKGIKKALTAVAKAPEKMTVAALEAGGVEVHDPAMLATHASAYRQALAVVVNQMRDGAEIDQEKAFERTFTYLSQEPAFIVERMDSKKAPEDMTPPTWSGKYATLAKMWEFVLKRVLADAGLYIPFMPGFTFDGDVEAKCVTGDVHTFLLAPLRGGKHFFKSVAAKVLLSEELKDLAIHEAAHVRCPYHNEEFVDEMHRIRVACRRTAFRRVLIDAHKAVPV